MDRSFRKWFMTAAVLIAVLWTPSFCAYAVGNTMRFSDTGIEGTGTGHSISGTFLTITEPGVYEISGSCTNGSITVNKNLQDVVLKMKDLNLASALTAPLLIGKSADVIIVTEGRTVLQDNEPADSPETEGACIKLKSGAAAELRGSGTLEICGNIKNGIKGGAGAIVTFSNEAGGTVTVSAKNNGIACDGSIVVNSGNISVSAGGDALKAVPDAEDAVSAGTVVINGGTINIKTDGDGIQAETITVNSGTINIETLDGYRSGGTKLYLNGFGRSIFGRKSFYPETMSCKGLKASGNRGNNCLLEVKGGTFHLNCADDAVHSDGCAKILGGKWSIDTGDDGIHGDESLIFGREGTGEKGPDITISNSFEGLDGGNIDIYTGNYAVTALNDGINAAWGDGSITGDNHVIIYGGDLIIDSRGDGIDSNGDIHLLGGKLIICSQAKGGVESPLDVGAALFISGAEVLAAGTPGVDGIASAACFGDSQKYIISTEVCTPGTTIKAGQDMSVSCTVKLKRYANYVLYTAPSSKELFVNAVPEEADQPETGKDQEPAGTGDHGGSDGTGDSEEPEPSATTGSKQPSATAGSKQPSATTGSKQSSATTGSKQSSATTGSKQSSVTAGSKQPSAPAQTKTPGTKAVDKSKTGSSPAKREEPAGEEPVKETAAPLLLAKMTAVKKTKLKLKWTKIPSADGYEIWFGYCKSGNSKKGYKLIRTIRKAGKTGCTISGLKKNSSYKAVVKAFQKVKGKKKYLAASCPLHALTAAGNARYCNPGSVVLKTKKVTLKTGKSYKIKKAKIKKTVSGRKLMKHAKKFRYASSDSRIASVSGSGKISAKAPGKCRIYVIANNGVCAFVKVTVK